jgi:hypothetical protein
MTDNEVEALALTAAALSDREVARTVCESLLGVLSGRIADYDEYNAVCARVWAAFTAH